MSQGCIKLGGPRAVPARSGQDSTRTFSLPEPPGLFLCAASRDGSRSDPELAAVLVTGQLRRRMTFSECGPPWAQQRGRETEI
jgi:hypothetical protein